MERGREGKRVRKEGGREKDPGRKTRQSKGSGNRGAKTREGGITWK